MGFDESRGACAPGRHARASASFSSSICNSICSLIVSFPVPFPFPLPLFGCVNHFAHPAKCWSVSRLCCNLGALRLAVAAAMSLHSGSSDAGLPPQDGSLKKKKKKKKKKIFLCFTPLF